MRLWAFLFFCLISVNAGAAEEGALTRAAKSFLKPQKFPTVFNDASFSTRMQVLAQGYEPWETEYDSAGRCISGCAYSTMNIEEDLRQMQQATQNAVIELQDLGYLPAKPTSDHSHQGQTVPPKQVVSTQTDKPHQGQAPLNNLQPVQLVKPPVKDQIQQTPPSVAPEKPSVPDNFQSQQGLPQRPPVTNGGQDVPLGWPVKGRPKITSPFGRRTHPVTGNQQNHSGVDLGVGRGTDVFVPANGRVVSVWTDNTCGRGIKILHSRGYETVYCHLDEHLVTAGQHVTAGGLIGRSGNTGRSTGPHLHYAIKKDGTYIDPTELMR